MTGERLVSRLLMPNVTLRTLVRDYRARCGMAEQLRGAPDDSSPAIIEVVSSGDSVEHALEAAMGLPAPPPAPPLPPPHPRPQSRLCLLL